MLNSVTVLVLAWLISCYSTALYDVLQHQRLLIPSCLLLDIAAAFILLLFFFFLCCFYFSLLLYFLLFLSKLTLTSKIMLQNLDFSQATWQLNLPVTDQETTCSSYIFLQLGSSEKSKNHCGLCLTSEKGSGRGIPPEIWGQHATQSTELHNTTVSLRWLLLLMGTSGLPARR